MHRTQTRTQSGLPGSRLVQLLGSLDSKAARASHGDFAERLGRLFDLSDAISLDGATRFTPKGPFNPSDSLPQELQDALLKARHALLEHLSRSFAGEKAASVIALPPLSDDADAEKRPSFGAYERFYQAHQRQIIAGLSNLRLRCRRLLTGHSATLAHLAELDAVFENGLSSYARQGFAALPGFLDQRYRLLWQQRDPFHTPADWLGPHGWLSQFRRELKMLLLAELDARQEPVLGLLAAAREATESSPAAAQDTNEVSPTP
ncbi:DUF3348 family protein [Alcanivorax sp. DP30]|uniref:DUF3348 family protein n=1 Tax=Alcanivorax sp. DP30 TaxID=2606217 RepID=UPI00136DDB32|nr:DUF3348 family protein [Alcanivorax sp. DP30]MZR63368.1 DUF3348 family protein [Alcanivorax sp. DP30]